MLKRFFIYFFIIFIQLSTTYYGATVYQFNPFISKIGFSTTFLKLFNVEGEFRSASIFVKFDEQKQIIENLDAKIDTNSIVTGLKLRDRHLKEEKFLNAVKYPYIGFKLEQPLTLSDTVAKGSLSIKNIVKKVEIPVKIELVKRDGIEMLQLIFKSDELVLNRNEYEVSGLAGFIRDDIDIELVVVTQQLKR